jgi:serine/threonine protein kinase
MTKLGKYETLKEIGRGGFAVVYRARDTELDRIVALKVLHPRLTTDPKFIQRFHQEARAAAGLHHSHIVTVYEVGGDAGQHFLAMTFLPGRTLDKRLAQGPIPMSIEQAISIVEQVAGALDRIHEQGLVHRDVKPGNITVDDAGQATLLDFGIVRAAEGTRLTTTMAVLGTPEYRAPEQAELEGRRRLTGGSTSTRWGWWPTRRWWAARRSPGDRPRRSCTSRSTNHRPRPPR